MKVPALRVRRLNDRPIRADGRYVLYWMLAQRRSAYNWALDRAVEHAVDLGRPLLVFEALRAGHRWSSARVHRFVLDGMAANAEAFAGSPACYMPWVEPAPGAGRGLLARLAAEACVVVTDDSTVFDLREVAARGAAAAAVRVEAVDGDGLLPLRLADRAFPTAYAFRRFLQRELPGRLDERPKQRPFAGLELPVLVAPPTLDGAWAPTDLAALGRRDDLLDGLAFAHDVPALGAAGGSAAGRARLRRFIDEGLARYGEGRNHPSEDAASGLSPWLHFGHLSVHEVLAVVAKAEDWTPAGLGGERRGARNGFWGMSASAEAFLDECVTWRELGRNNAALLDGFATYGSLPDWARRTLAEHRRDRRPHSYTYDELEAAETHDPVWNAAQRQLRGEGVVHNYLRMLWGKKVLEWSPSPEEAWDRLVELNNRWAIDGRDPNSWTGIAWVFGRHDRPWGPERPIYGTIRYMSSENTARKTRLGPYLERWGPQPSLYPDGGA